MTDYRESLGGSEDGTLRGSASRQGRSVAVAPARYRDNGKLVLAAASVAIVLLANAVKPLISTVSRAFRKEMATMSPTRASKDTWTGAGLHRTRKSALEGPTGKNLSIGLNQLCAGRHLFAVSYVARTYLLSEVNVISSATRFFGPAFFLGALVTFFFLAITAQLPRILEIDLARFLALLYLGIQPTAWANLGIQTSTTRFGVSFTKCVESLRPLFGYLALLLLWLIFGGTRPEITVHQVAGLMIVILGAFVAARFGLTMPKQNTG